ncbi:MAG: S49 family peptidase, partial [Alphaproteobacteria bacterium]|nr:S49 family peptidase [Alphaproteobacteria bacterium]
SIGVVSSFFGLDRMIEKIGVERRIYTSGENKAMLDMFQPEKAGDVKHLKIIQKEMHETFKEIVLERRGSKLNASSLEENLDLFSGAFWTGSTAVELGLVDHLGDLHGVLKEKYGDTLVLRPMSSGEGWVKRCFRSSVSLFGGAIDSLESRALWGRLGL